MASCDLWLKDNERPEDSKDFWDDVTIGSADDLNQAEEWMADQIVRFGYAPPSNPYRQDMADHTNSLAKLGLVSKTKRITVEGSDKKQVKRVLIVGDDPLRPYRAAIEKTVARRRRGTVRRTRQAGTRGHGPGGRTAGRAAEPARADGRGRRGGFLMLDARMQQAGIWRRSNTTTSTTRHCPARLIARRVGRRGRLVPRLSGRFCSGAEELMFRVGAMGSGLPVIETRTSTDTDWDEEPLLFFDLVDPSGGIRSLCCNPVHMWANRPNTRTT